MHFTKSDGKILSLFYEAAQADPFSAHQPTN